MGKVRALWLGLGLGGKLAAMVLGAGVEEGLFARPIDAVDEAVLANSPVFRVHAAAPPFLIEVGDRARIVGEHEARPLHDALVRVGADSRFHVLGGAGHESGQFDNETNLAMCAAWIKATLKNG